MRWTKASLADGRSLTLTGVRLAIAAGSLGLVWQVVQLEAAPPPAAVQTPAPHAAVPAPPRPAPPAEPVMLRLDRDIQHGDFAWNEAGAPPGRIEIRVDLGTQLLSVFRGGHEIGRAAILYGTDEQPTPLGTFPIIERKRDHVSNLYDAPMPFMLRLTNDGIAIHGSEVIFGGASRGCIGIPDEFAELLFDHARLGDRVIIVDSSRAQAAPAG